VRTGTHVSDLILCLRQPFLMRKYQPEWDALSLFRFEMGRSLEKVVFSTLLPDSTQEMEVEEDGIVGHIDFASDPYDYECKLTWSHPKDDPEENVKFWWLEQAGSYAVMRRRDACKFIVLHLFPVPKLSCYFVEWTRRELGDLWSIMLKRKEYSDKKEREGLLPARTSLKWLCKGCPVENVCYELVGD
jgi:CRISPR/Cas system-associated exonuclease Cas4 (RecB family)